MWVGDGISNSVQLGFGWSSEVAGQLGALAGRERNTNPNPRLSRRRGEMKCLLDSEDITALQHKACHRLTMETGDEIQRTVIMDSAIWLCNYV